MTDHPQLHHRSLSLAAPAPSAALEALRRVEGIEEASLSQDGRHLRLRYDLRHVGLGELEQCLPALGFALNNGLLARLARRWGAFREANLRSHAAIHHKCCNNLDAD